MARNTANEINEHQANCHIGRIIEREALQMGLEAFFDKYTESWRDPKGYSDLRDFAKGATRSNLPDYCSFDAFFAKFAARFAVWYETGDYHGIADDQAEE